MNDALSQENLFENLMTKFRNRYKVLADTLQADMEIAVRTHLDVVRGTLDMIRSENIALESEQDPEFRRRVETAVETAQDDIRRIQAVVR